MAIRFFRPSVAPIALFTAFSAAAMLSGAWLSGCAPSNSQVTAQKRYNDAPPEPAFDRTAFGASPLPIWSALTPPEVRALQDRDKALAGNADALLALAVLASGDERSADQYAAIAARVHAFVAKLKPDMDERNPKLLGRKLFRRMHEEFFGSSSREYDIVKGYDVDQSRFTDMFRSGKFNCISSAMLYIILAREFGLDAQGVLLPNHAFAQLRMPDGKIVEVETTSPSGYDLVHDQTFYRDRAPSWFAARGLYCTYADYQRRRIETPAVFIAENMNNQHTRASIMPPADRYRLIEARAWIDSASEEAQNNRIAVYSSEFPYLSKRKDWAVLERLYRTVMPLMPGLRARWARDTTLSLAIAWQPYYYATTLLSLGRAAEAPPWLDSSMAWRRYDTQDGLALRSNQFGLACNLVQDQAERKQFQAAEKTWQRYPALASDAAYHSTAAWLYEQWSDDAWNRKDWAAAVEKTSRCLVFAEGESRKPVLRNLINAYLNWALECRNRNDGSKARIVLRECLDKVPDAEPCRKSLRAAEEMGG